ncbi:MAG: hypothetical protein M1160_01695 [Candidatus Marsarchaeota archaeon]|nr:hypothetical protein [Candidatus Marsarchaeota archaeon]MCL5111576.1 hypothetical protein [Candidatus Marsarchaeota archaeon]
MRPSSIGRALARVYRPQYIALNIAVAAVYYLIFTYLIRLQNYGVLLITVPKPLIYALVITASMMLTIGVFTLRNTSKGRLGVKAGTAGAFATVFAGVISGCGCSAPLLYGITAFGLSIAEVSVANAFIVNYSIEIVSALIAINIVLIAYNSWKLS